MGFVSSESNNLSLVLKITLEDPPGDATTTKHKQSDLSSQEVVRLRSQDSHQRPTSPQHTNKELSPAGNVQEQILVDAEMYEAGPQVKPAPLSSENQQLMEKDFASHGSPESSTNFNL